MKIWLRLLSLLLVLTACQEPENRKPQDPLWGRETCANCRMLLNEKRFAVQKILNNGEVYFYDDINCALKHDHTHTHSQPEDSLYVRPYGGEEWVLASEAKYTAGHRTPMDSGLGAVKEGGTITFEEVKEKLKN